MLREIMAVAAALCAAGTGSALGQNVVVNGDFESGNTGFTTAYSFAPGQNTLEGEYTIRNNPLGWNPGFLATGDHTTGAGLMMVVNGGTTPSPLLLWGQTVQVVPGRAYRFSMWVRTVVDGQSAVLLATINGTQLLPAYPAPELHSVGWTGFTRTWVADGPTATIDLRNLNTSRFPNDFVIDDIALTPVCRADLNDDGELTFDDIQLFVSLYNASDARADFNNDGEWTFDDIQLFVQLYNAGC